MEIILLEFYWEKIGPGTALEQSTAGLYQIYGVHPTNGPNNLLYIGKSKDLNVRLATHAKWWINFEPNNCEIYYGKLVNSSLSITDEVNPKVINIAEKLLIYYCQPAYNSSSGADFNEVKVEDKTQYIVMNYGHKNLLPYELSTLHFYSKCWYKKDDKEQKQCFDFSKHKFTLN